MIDSNYLGHNLIFTIKYYPNYDYQCKKCGIILFYDDEKPDDDTYQYNLCIGDSVINPRIKCILTCNEFLIKSILE